MRAMTEIDELLTRGVVDVIVREDVARRLRTFLDAGLPPERLWAVPDCGFWETPRWLCQAKLGALGSGAALVRKSLGA